MQFLVSAGEASGDLYAAGLVRHLSQRFPSLSFYGCAGPKLEAEGVTPIINSAELAVVGLAEVVHQLPRLYRNYRKLVGFVERHPPAAALLTDSPDFHLRLARHLKRLRVPVFYLVAPQVWAWRQWRVKTVRERVDKLFCLFPFEEEWFCERGVDATYIGHPLAGMAKVTQSREQFFARHSVPSRSRLLALLPGSRAGEIRRHLPILLDSAAALRRRFALSIVLATPKGFRTHEALAKYREPLKALSIKVVENETWDCIGHADVALAASGTVTIEAAVLGTPMVTFYKVSPLSWYAGRHFLKVPFLSMVNLVAGREVVPELIQHTMTSVNIVAAAEELLSSDVRADRMRADLARVRQSLTREGDPLGRAAELIAATCAHRFSVQHDLGGLVQETMS
ncbi:MAG: lipid-A-disaccharide synthase [Acidobacteria bacterium]|nr:lipid-A-disaccharide synthase [Acidobacteriota bacterium]